LTRHVRKLRLNFTLLVAAAIVAAVAATSAYAASISTQVEIGLIATRATGDNVVVGIVKSPNPKCRRYRTVKLYKRVIGTTSFTLVDTDRTSRHGAWAARGDVEDADRIKVSATRAKRHHGDVVCESAHALALIGPPPS
jgi:hypothetical protein